MTGEQHLLLKKEIQEKCSNACGNFVVKLWANMKLLSDLNISCKLKCMRFIVETGNPPFLNKRRKQLMMTNDA